jgi:hypothetical protein
MASAPNRAGLLLRRAVRDDGPEDALRAIAALREELERLEEHQVERAIARGSSWARIGAALGITKQAAHKRHRGREPRAA